MMEHSYPQQVVIVGFGITGQACLDFFQQRHIQPKIIDTRPQQQALLAQLSPIGSYHVGDLRLDWLLQAELVILSPGISRCQPAIQRTIAAGIPVISEIELFCREIKQPVVAITGTNGKSTVTAWVAEMARQAGLRVGAGGNLGPTALSLLKSAYDLYVVELSSFQLESTYSLQAAAATILNITPDHQDRYPQGMNCYQQAKQRIYQQATHCVVNSDDLLTQPLTLAPKATIRTFGTQGSYRWQAHQNAIWLIHEDQRLLPVSRLKLLGQHNYANALAALALADAVGIPREPALQALITFEGLAHRCQPVWQRRGVSWINDSKSTTVESTLAALQGLPAHRQLHLLLGGRSKPGNYQALVPYLQRDNLQLYCFGEAAEQLAALRPAAVEKISTLEAAMRLVAQRVASGDIVLLSPACASFDQFSNFAQRGEQFTQLARRLG